MPDDPPFPPPPADDEPAPEPSSSEDAPPAADGADEVEHAAEAEDGAEHAEHADETEHADDAEVEDVAPSTGSADPSEPPTSVGSVNAVEPAEPEDVGGASGAAELVEEVPAALGETDVLAAKPPPDPSKLPLPIPSPDELAAEPPPPPPPPPPPDAPPPVSDTPTATESTTPRRRGRRRTLALLLVVALVGSLIAVGRRGDHGPPHPKRWDPRVAELATFVERARGLAFHHPVTVRFLSPSAYTKATNESTGDLDDEDRADLVRQAAQLRALGVISGKVDLVKALTAETDAGTLAFYSPTDEVVRVRGTAMSVGLKVTLVHELTHALQDQHFGLRHLVDVDDDSASAARRGLAEGDAIRIEQDYVTQVLTPQEQQAYDAEQDQQLATSQHATADVPDFVTASFAAPYALGSSFVQTLYADGGNATVDRAFRSPPPSEQDLFDPATYLAKERPARPALDLHGVKVREQGTFGGPTWFLVLAERIDPTTAFQAALGWAGDRYGIYEQDHTTCTRVVFQGRTRRDEQRMRAAIDAWVKALPGGKARRSVVGGHPAIDACDPGPAADLRLTNRAVDVLILPNRWGLVVAQVAKDLGPDGSRCFAGRVLDGLTYQQLADPSDAPLTNAISTRSISAYSACRKQPA